mmetsp:Transcript_31679/g.55678  ORF Transcript_31679/g.55678 Transcript_31679/m.55678 type:complete len:266 (-) Transcript_31679:146-943(-)
MAREQDDGRQISDESNEMMLVKPWCFQNFNGMPMWLVVHILIFCVIIYSSYISWAAVVLSIWNEYCNKESTHYSYGYVLASIICLVFTISGGVYVGFYVADNNLYITIMAVAVDLITLAMTIWGMVLYFQRSENTCGYKYAVEAPSFFIFFNATFGFWMFHFVVVAMLINCVGYLRFKWSKSLQLLTDREIKDIEDGKHDAVNWDDVLQRLPDNKQRSVRLRRQSSYASDANSIDLKDLGMLVDGQKRSSVNSGGGDSNVVDQLT